MTGIDRCVVLAGGTGGARLAAGLQDLLGDGLSVIANTADDVEVLGVDVSPDPDLVTYWLSEQIDEEQGWGIKGDSSVTFDRLVQLGAPDWFKLTDRDLATCLYRTNFMAEGGRRTDAQAQIARALGARASVLPMTEQRVRTRVRTAAGWRGLQEFLIVDHGEPEVEAVELEGIGEAEPTPEALAAVEAADAIVIGPSNPVISIGPILALPGMRAALRDSPAPVVAVSPIVDGAVLKGPTAAFMEHAGLPLGAAGIARAYAGVIDALLADEDAGVGDVPVRVASTLMSDAAGRARVAREALELACAIMERR